MGILLVVLNAVICGGPLGWLVWKTENRPDREPEARLRAAGAHTQREGLVPPVLNPTDQDLLEYGPVWVVTLYGPVTTDHLRDVGSLTRLQDLTVFGSPVAKDGLPSLSGLGHLERLTLIDTDLTDSDLAHLHGLQTLRHTYMVNNPGITLDGIKLLQQKLPKLYIAYYKGTHTGGESPDYVSDGKP